MHIEDIQRIKQQETIQNNYTPKAQAIQRVIRDIQHELIMIDQLIHVELQDTTPQTDMMLQHNLEILTDVLTNIKAR